MGMLEAIASKFDRFNRILGKGLSWLTLTLVLAQFSLVILTSVFHIGSTWAQESLLYINSLMFLGAAGYVLLVDDHVRVDIFYGRATEKVKAWVNFLGSLFLLIPMLVLTWVTALPYVAFSWKIYEGSSEISGIQAIYILKTFILLFAFVLTLQCISLTIRSYMTIREGET
jgi:TRAP-type mannitol/chloroaromatic compound transport system permease small subunit